MKLAAQPTSRSALAWLHLLAACILVLACGAAGAAQAVPPPPGGSGGEAVDPPGRVGRLADLQGQVWMFSPESGEWVTAVRNRVLTTGDRLATDPGARAELRIGSTTLRLDGGSEVEFERLDDQRIDLRLHTGAAALRVRNREAVDELSVLTGEGRFTVQRTGRYRFDRIDENSHLTVNAGQALYEGPRSALTVNSGQRAEFWIDAAGIAQYAITDPLRDGFASWNAERDRADDRSASARYVSPEMTGVEELDRHGRWQQNDEYGALWVPNNVAPGWAPYSTGRWAWVQPWGWTWVDDAPWGFAPFHYGRWLWTGGVWAWAPGTYVQRPVWAPALVAWVGGPNVSVSVRIGGGYGPAVGWFPLAPREVYVPAYRHSPIYVRNVNVTHVTNVTVINNAVSRPVDNPYDLRYRKFPNAVTVVPQSVVTGRQPVAAAAAQARDTDVARQLMQAPVTASTRLAPARGSTGGAWRLRRFDDPGARGRGAGPQRPCGCRLGNGARLNAAKAEPASPASPLTGGTNASGGSMGLAAPPSAAPQQPAATARPVSPGVPAQAAPVGVGPQRGQAPAPAAATAPPPSTPVVPAAQAARPVPPPGAPPPTVQRRPESKAQAPIERPAAAVRADDSPRAPGVQRVPDASARATEAQRSGEVNRAQAMRAEAQRAAQARQAEAQVAPQPPRSEPNRAAERERVEGRKERQNDDRR